MTNTSVSRVAISLLIIVSLALTTDSTVAEDLPLAETSNLLEFTVDEGSWVSVSLHPSNEYFIFDLLGDIYSLPISGGSAERITSGMAFDSQPVISPSGEKIAFISDRNGKNNLWIADIDGSNPIQLSDETYTRMLSPAWTTDSSYVTVTERGKEIELKQYHVDGGSGTTVSQADDDNSNPPAVDAAFSPDGNTVYFAEKLGSPDAPTEDFPVTQIVRLNLNDGSRLQITRGEGGAVRPKISPDGKLLIYGTRYQT
ncbi:MAG: Tol biopolymer transport system component, partial [Cyclobacteriaceae bacterium]